MDQEQFKVVLREKKIRFFEKTGEIIINHLGAVDLNSLNSLPENVTFENQGDTYLNSLTFLPENIKFKNLGIVGLTSITTLSKNAQFENQSAICLNSLTVLSENVTFKNQGIIGLNSLKNLSENVKFENQGYIYLRSLENEEQIYQGQKIRLKYIDDHTVIIGSKRELGNITIYNARYFSGGEINEMKECFLANQGKQWAHGDSSGDAENLLKASSEARGVIQIHRKDATS